ncbi:FAD-dependent monooxygenase [Micromonosporaceae bacterium Da 78-11]
MAATNGIGPQVIVVGAGPVGLLLAGELRLGGAEVVVIERQNTATTESRASTLHARTMELFDSRGLLATIGTPPHEPLGHFGGIPLDLSQPSRWSGQWKIPQTRVEEMLQAWALSLGAEVWRGAELVGLHDDGDTVEVTIRRGTALERLQTAYLVGCDGEESTVRRLTGAAFPGRPARRELLRADVAGVEIANRRFQRLPHGLAIASRRPDGVTRVMVHEFGRSAERSRPVAFDEVVDVWKRVTGEDLSGGRPLWVNAFGDANRQLDRYRHGRVLFAGDAAHIQMPVGGQALNLGLQDAMNLGWKLALSVRPQPPAGLLDSYHDERHAAGAAVLANIRAQALLLLGDEEVEPIREVLAGLIVDRRNAASLAGTISGIGLAYPVLDGGDHPLVGRRLPDLTFERPDGPLTSAALFHRARGVLLDLSARQAGPLSWMARLWGDRVVTVQARPVEADAFAGQEAVLVRPDGHVAWVGSAADGLRASLRRWFGSAEPER